MLQSVSLLALVSWGVQILWIPMILFRQHEMKTDLFWVQIASEVFQGVSGLSDLSSLVCRLVSLGRNDSPFCRSRWTQVTKMIRPPGLHTRCISDINLGPMIAHDCPWLPSVTWKIMQNHKVASCKGTIAKMCIMCIGDYWCMLRALAWSTCNQCSQFLKSVPRVFDFCGMCSPLSRDQIKSKELSAKGILCPGQKTRQPFLSLVASCNQSSRNWKPCGFWADLPWSQITGHSRSQKDRKSKDSGPSHFKWVWTEMNSDMCSMVYRKIVASPTRMGDKALWIAPYGPSICNASATSKLHNPSWPANKSAGKMPFLRWSVWTFTFWIQMWKSKAVVKFSKTVLFWLKVFCHVEKERLRDVQVWYQSLDPFALFLVSGLFSLKDLLPALAALDSKLCLQQLWYEKNMGSRSNNIGQKEFSKTTNPSPNKTREPQKVILATTTGGFRKD